MCAREKKLLADSRMVHFCLLTHCVSACIKWFALHRIKNVSSSSSLSSEIALLDDFDEYISSDINQTSIVGNFVFCDIIFQELSQRSLERLSLIAK